LSAQQVAALVDLAVSGRRCVQAWLGFGEVLFMGFGEQVLNPVGRGQRHPKPAYELQTNFANWQVSHNAAVVGTADSERGLAQKSVALFVGQPVLSWTFAEGLTGLRIVFEGRYALDVTALSDLDVVDKAAWLVRDPNGVYAQVSCRGMASRIL